jgi:small-conductance mechanosensitive channel
MELRKITHAITKTIVIVVFWIIFLIDLLLSPIISFREIAFALVKAIVLSGIFWVLFVMLVDTFLKTVLMDAKEKNVNRVDGGLSYHVTEPSAEELAWMKTQEKEKNQEHAALAQAQQAQTQAQGQATGK